MWDASRRVLLDSGQTAMLEHENTPMQRAAARHDDRASVSLCAGWYDCRTAVMPHGLPYGYGMHRSRKRSGAAAAHPVMARLVRYGMHRSRKRSGAAAAHPVMARLVRAINSS